MIKSIVSLFTVLVIVASCTSNQSREVPCDLVNKNQCEALSFANQHFEMFMQVYLSDSSDQQQEAFIRMTQDSAHKMWSLEWSSTELAERVFFGNGLDTIGEDDLLNVEPNSVSIERIKFLQVHYAPWLRSQIAMRKDRLKNPYSSGVVTQ